MAQGSIHQVGRGGEIAVSLTDPIPNPDNLTVAAAAQYATSIDVTPTTGPLDVLAGELLVWGDGTDPVTVSKVTADVTLAANPAATTVTIEALPEALAGTETATYYNKYTHIGGVENIDIAPDRGTIQVNNMDDWAYSSFVSDLINTTISLGTIQIFQNNAGQKILRQHHYQNLSAPAFFNINQRDGQQFWFCGFTSGVLGSNNASQGAVISGPATIQVNGAITTQYVF